jgi:DNA end-binding protein Ku
MAADEDRYDDEVSSPSPRSFWSGTISFGLVSVPVDLYPASRSQRAPLRMLDEDGTPLRRQFYDPEKDRPVEDDEIVRGFELDDGSYVVVTDEELEALEPRKSRDIDLRLFVDVDELDPLYFERAYFLVPSSESNKAYRLLAEIMERTRRAGIATFVMRTKEYLIAIIAENGILRAETLRFTDEVRSTDELDLPSGEAADTTVRRLRRAIAKQKRKQLATTELRDAQTERLQALAAKKASRGEDVVEIETEAAADDSVIDLMEVLKRSMRAADERTRTPAKKGARKTGGRRVARAPAKRAAKRGKAGARKTASSRTASAGGEELATLSKPELYERAQRAGIEGRSGMTKAELVRALRDA